jgi:hypothetical protein
VLAGAAGGDGTLASPWGRTTEFAFGSLRAGTIVALGRGRYDESIRLPAGVSLYGACAAETSIGTSSPDDAEGVVTVRSGGGITIRDLAIVDSPRAGVVAEGDGVEATLDGVWIENVRHSGVQVAFGGRVEARSLVVRATRASPSGSFGRGVDASVASSVALTRGVLAENHDAGAFAGADASVLALSDVAIRDTQPRTDGTGGAGVMLSTDATATVVRSMLERNGSDGVFATEPGVSVRVEQSLIRDTESRPSDGTGGSGVFLQREARGEVLRSLLERNRGGGIAVLPGSTARIEDVVVRDHVGEATGARGRGLDLEGDTTAARVLVERTREWAVFVSGVVAVQIDDLTARECRSRIVDDWGGRGLGVQNGATVHLGRALFADLDEFGITAIDDSVVGVSDVVVRDVGDGACDGSICLHAGIGAYVGSRLTADRFAVARCDLCGLHVGEGGEIDATNGDVSESGIGVCVEVSGYDLDRLTNMVSYRDNDVNFDTTSTLPLPTSAPPI